MLADLYNIPPVHYYFKESITIGVAAMLSAKIDTFVTEQNLTKDPAILINSIFRYLLRLATSHETSRAVRIAYGQEVSQALRVFKKDILDSTSYTLSRLWRGIYLCVRSRDCHFCTSKLNCASKFNNQNNCNFAPSVARIASALEVDPKDIKLGLKYLTPEDFEKIKAKPEYAEWPRDAELKQMVMTLKAHANNLRRKLKFVENNHAEWGSETKQSPIVNDLLMEGYRIALKYDFYLELAHIKNCCIQWMHNYAINLIKKNTAKSRQNIVRTHRSITRSHGLDQDFVTMTASLDMGMSEENDSFCMYKLIPSEDRQEDIDQAIDNDHFLNVTVKKLKKYSASKKCTRFIDIIMGQPDAEFTEWLTTRGIVIENMPVEKVAALARECLKLSSQQLKRQVGTFLKEEISGRRLPWNY